MAAQQLDPPPRDFTRAQQLTEAAILAAIEQGRSNTAMQSFAGLLPPDDRRALARFVLDEFVTRRAPNTAYHTAENGWPDHRRRYGEAFGFVSCALDLDRPIADLTPEQKRGRALFLEACITCHEPRETAALWRSHPHSHQGEPVRDLDSLSRASHYAVHDRPPRLEGLTALEEKGKALYEANCAFCHAADGTGRNWIGSFLEPNPRNLTDARATAHLDPSTLAGVIRDGLPGTSMPAWGAVLNEAEQAAIAAYVRRAFLDPARQAAR